jgi:hypothetical protein
MKQLQSVMITADSVVAVWHSDNAEIERKTLQLPAANEFDDTQTHEILPRLFLGGIYSATKADVLEHLGVSVIVNCSAEVPLYFPERFTYRHLKLNDDLKCDIGAHFAETLALLAEARKQQKGVLVHCLAGLSRWLTLLVVGPFGCWRVVLTFVLAARSATFVLAFLMQQEKMTLRDAYWHCKARRHIVRAWLAS